MEQTDKKISQMPPLQTVSGDEIVPVVKSGGNYSALVSQIVALARQTMVEAQAGKGLSANDFTDADKAVVGSLPATILTNPHVIASGGETYLNVTYDMATLTDGAYSTTTKTVSIPTANPATSRAGLMSVPDKIKLDGIEEGANNYVLPVASTSVRGGVVLNTAWQTPTLVSEDADGKNVPFEMANESSSSGILKPACKVYVDNEPTSGSNHLMTSGAVHTAKYNLFDDQWTAADGTVIVSGQTYGVNGINDLTYEEALKIMSYYSEQIDAESRIRYAACPCRTLLPIRGRTYTNTVTSRMFFWSNKLEALVLADIEATESWGMFGNCSNLRTIDGIIGVRNQKQLDKMFGGCKALKEVRISYLGASISFADSPNLSLDSISFIVTNAANTSAITITVHPDVYAKLTGDITNAAAADLTAEEAAQWQALAVAAGGKQITFATTN